MSWARVCVPGGGEESPTPDTIPGPCLENPQWFVAPKLTTPAPAHLALGLGVHPDVPTPAFPGVYLALGCGILHIVVQELLPQSGK